MKNVWIGLLAATASIAGFSQNEIKKDTLATPLEEIAVKGNAKSVSIKNGNIKLDIPNSAFKTVSNSLDLLSKLPKVQVSPDKESIYVVGKGQALLYIDNQKVEINELNSLAVEDIKSIEILQNPSSKYEAAGRAVILVTRKLSKKEGLKAMITENASFKKYFNNYFGTHLDIKKGKLEIRSNFNYNQLVVWESNGNDFLIPSEGIAMDYLVKAVTKRPQFVFGSGIFYKINADDYLSFNVSCRTQKDKFDITTMTYSNIQNIENRIATTNRNNEDRQYYSAFFNYNHALKSIEGLLFTGFQYTNLNRDMSGLIYDNYNDTGFEPVQKRNQEFAVSVFSGRADFEKKFKNETKLELGALFLQARSDNGSLTENFNPEGKTDTQYLYKERNSAAYSQFSGTLKKWRYTLGLRAENTYVKGKIQSEKGILVARNYTDIFPKLEAELPIDSTKSVSFRYAKSISRPDFSSLSQATAYINPYFAFSGNSNLDPSLTDEITVDFQRNEMAIGISYIQKKHPVYYGSIYDNTQHLLTLKPINFEKESGFNFEFTMPFSYRFWSTTNVFSAVLNKVEDNAAVIRQAKPYGYWYSNNTFKLPKEFTLMVTGWGLTRQQEGIFERKGIFTLDATVSKTFLQHFDCTLSCTDIFRKLNTFDNYTVNAVMAKGRYFSDAHMLSLSVKYSFGKLKNQGFKEKDIDENANRIR
ncbi:outer membrane beta-barrel family protein [Flavobacterium humi]|uniref:TonB-dependent receptor n=1 Tax=Flavobacterium humi TaxID=2562683 RepID=A0A4Z0LCI6_9FLAO|nr:outer membrane beta-barrel family protein [Flavobacterium humi]TGD59600.1 TonB-dependent receptor [Flavobacterium humi]